jgi:predicted phosphoribosyltransferase
MNFTSRTVLGDDLTRRLENFRGKGAIIACLTEGSLLTCLTVARKIHAWVYPLLYAPVHSQRGKHELLGAYDADGNFCPDPDGPAAESDIPPVLAKEIKAARPDAMEAIQIKRTAYGMQLDKHKLDGRDVILVADVLTSELPLLIASQYFASVTPKSLTAVYANVVQDAVPLARMSAADVTILDVLSGVVLDEERYFEHPDAYDLAQKQSLTKHIAAYWQ